MALTDDIEDTLLVSIPGSPNSDVPPKTENERVARSVVDACSDYFSELSLHLRKLHSDLPPELQSWLPQIAGGAFYAQFLVILEGLKTKEDVFGHRLVFEFGEQIASRVNEALASQHHRSNLDNFE